MKFADPVTKHILTASQDVNHDYAWLAKNDPNRLLQMVKDADLRPSRLTFAAEAAGLIADSTAVREALLPLLNHQSAVVREGAIYGMSNHVNERVFEVLLRIAADDSSPAVRQAASDLLEVRMSKSRQFPHADYCRADSKVFQYECNCHVATMAKMEEELEFMAKMVRGGVAAIAEMEREIQQLTYQPSLLERFQRDYAKLEAENERLRQLLKIARHVKSPKPSRSAYE